MKRLAFSAFSAFALLSALPAGAQAAGPPQIGAIWTTGVKAAGATFHAEVNPEGQATTYRFEYVTDQVFQESAFANAAKAPSSGAPSSVGSGTSPLAVQQSVSALRAATTYHYRITATNSSAPTTSSEATFLTQAFGGGPILLDERGWELVSPPDKNGGSIQGPEQIHGGGVIQAAPSGYPAAGAAITYSSASSFGGYAAQGGPAGSQYISTRTASGWSTQNITAPAVSGSYGNEPNGVPYQLFSSDLSRGLMLNGIHCRGEGSDCPVANPPLPGSGAPPGYQDYYLRANEDGTYTATVTAANAELRLEAEEFNLAFAGASPDLSHLILSTCAALTPYATEVPASGGCDPTMQNLYEWGEGQLTLVNVNPGAELAAQSAAVSADGSRVYFTEAGNLYMREGSSPPQLLAALGKLQTATPDGSLAFYTTEEAPGELHLFRYKASSHTSESLATGVKGVLGAAEDGATVYYQDQGALEEWHAGTVTTVASGAEAALQSDYPPATGTARVSADGSRLLFLSKEELSGYDNTDATTGQPDSEVFVWSGGLACISCNLTNERPIGPSTIAGAYANGQAPGSTDFYKPRNLSATADRAFFESEDALVSRDTNQGSDAYQWEAQGVGTCTHPGGCISLISSGTDGNGAHFVDASESGDDVYFLTYSSLVEDDPGSGDVYDARMQGGFPEPLAKIPCKGDACVPLPQGPEDPSVGTLIPGLPNSPVHFPAQPCSKATHRVTKHGHTRCVAKRLRHGKKHHGKKKGHK